jgi:hypothetical protein
MFGRFPGKDRDVIQDSEEQTVVCQKNLERFRQHVETSTGASGSQDVPLFILSEDGWQLRGNLLTAILRELDGKRNILTPDRLAMVKISSRACV